MTAPAIEQKEPTLKGASAEVPEIFSASTPYVWRPTLTLAGIGCRLLRSHSDNRDILNLQYLELGEGTLCVAKYFVDDNRVYFGEFDGADPPEAVIEILYHTGRQDACRLGCPDRQSDLFRPLVRS